MYLFFTSAIYPHPRGIQSGIFSSYLSTSQRDTKRDIFLLSIHIPERYKGGYFPLIYPHPRGKRDIFLLSIHPRGIQRGIFSSYLSTSQRDTKRDIFLLSIHIPEGYNGGYFPPIYPPQRDTKGDIFLLSIHRDNYKSP